MRVFTLILILTSISCFVTGCKDGYSVASLSPQQSATEKKGKRSKKMDEYNKLTDEEKYVILRKGTELPGTGKLLKNKAKGTYICKRCNFPLYKSESKFDSGCGWPSFDDEIKNAVRRETDADGYRTEILCRNCDAHLGHVFLGDRFTPNNTRQCVNALSRNFVASKEKLPAVINPRSEKSKKPVTPDASEKASSRESGK